MSQLWRARSCCCTLWSICSLTSSVQQCTLALCTTPGFMPTCEGGLSLTPQGTGLASLKKHTFIGMHDMLITKQTAGGNSSLHHGTIVST